MIVNISRDDAPEEGLELWVPDVKYATVWIAQLLELSWRGSKDTYQGFTVSLKRDVDASERERDVIDCDVCHWRHERGKCDKAGGEELVDVN